NSRPYRIAVFLQDFAYRIGVPGKIVEFADLACRIGVPGKIVEFAGFRLPDGRVQGNGAVFRVVEISIFLLKTSFSTA
ncbi:hypothetical protein HFN20_17855, partial [Paenibacillus dendritiformis]|uniref:hypothetical protein n=1 Tax=Paenibacillus dendritiformis TaxID=130049 RepID=UPI00143DDBAE